MQNARVKCPEQYIEVPKKKEKDETKEWKGSKTQNGRVKCPEQYIKKMEESNAPNNIKWCRRKKNETIQEWKGSKTQNLHSIPILLPPQ